MRQIPRRAAGAGRDLAPAASAKRLGPANYFGLAVAQLAYALFLPGFQRELLAPGFAEELADGLLLAMSQRLIAEKRARTPLSAISVMAAGLDLAAVGRLWRAFLDGAGMYWSRV